ncbi:MAG: lipid asymmetry maintenance ABC transporter permease subunit MlaE [Halioglobus sp.]
MQQLANLGRAGIAIMQALGQSAFLLWLALTAPLDRLSREFRRLVNQLYYIGVNSVLIVLLSGFFIGMVLALQGHTVLSRFGASEALGQLVSLALIRELGPVVAGLLFAGRAGSAITAELGFMKATEQLSALEMMGVDPMAHVLRPRLLAGIISMPILAQIFNAVAILSAWLVSTELLGVYSGSFWANMQQVVDFREDVVNGLIKAVVFGFVITWVAVHEGYNAAPNTEGINRSTTRSVVIASLSVLALDFILTALMFGD